MIRGEQLGAAIGATVKPNATADDCKNADVVVLVKRPSVDLLESVRHARVLVWDTVDFWLQPLDNGANQRQSVDIFRRKVSEIKPDAVICATAKMADDCGTPYYLYHHSNPSISRVPVRSQIKTIGYVGNPNYPGKFGRYLLRACEKRGLNYLVNPIRYDECDVLVSFREGEHTGYMPSQWKSNVKLANAQAAGIPFICQSHAGYLETDHGGVVYCEKPEEIGDTIDAIWQKPARQDMSDALVKSGENYTLAKIAEQYREMLENICMKS
jgi:hypothetical protein